MGKTTGFLEFKRKTEGYLPVEERTKNYKEFTQPLKEEDQKELFTLVENHYNLTMSPLAEKLLTNWEKKVGNFVKVFPEEYRLALIRIAEENQTINN
jgi:glutamate synthase domain-containing protein 3